MLALLTAESISACNRVTASSNAVMNITDTVFNGSNSTTANRAVYADITWIAAIRSCNFISGSSSDMGGAIDSSRWFTVRSLLDLELQFFRWHKQPRRRVFIKQRSGDGLFSDWRGLRSQHLEYGGLFICKTDHCPWDEFDGKHSHVQWCLHAFRPRGTVF
jgi:hypothetical protein